MATVPRFYATTAIAYVNDAPHIGHAYEVLLGDGVTRWHRLLGDDVKYVTGTDKRAAITEVTASLGVPKRVVYDIARRISQRG